MAMAMARPGQRRIYEILEKSGGAEDWASKLCDVFLAAIVLNLLAISLESVDRLAEAYHPYFLAFELFSVVIFSLEYALRLWAAPASGQSKTALQARLRYAFSFHGLVDLAAILPSLLTLVATGADLRWLRVLRMLRLFKISHYNSALEDLFSALKEERSSFAAALYLFLIAFFLASTLMHLAERALQPDHFGSIPAAMWWSIITLTTVGYGDVSPLSLIGKLIGGGTALMGVCTVALLTGIMANAFANQVQGRRTIFEAEVAHALEDGTITDDEQRLLEELRTRFDFSEEYARAIIELTREKREDGRASPPPSAGA
jgi:voltage-gated potassium channel